jgi:hypothetical protein
MRCDGDMFRQLLIDSETPERPFLSIGSTPRILSDLNEI